MIAVASSLVDGQVLINTAQLQIETFKVKIDAYAAVVDSHSHMLDALRYGFMAGTIQSPAAYPDPPATPPGLTPEQHAAHLAIHDLVSVEEFEEERNKPGFIQLNAHWGANGKRRFCCEKATKPTLGQKG